MHSTIVVVLASLIILSGMEEIMAYDLGYTRAVNSCKEDIMIRDVQLHSLMMVEKKIKRHE